VARNRRQGPQGLGNDPYGSGSPDGHWRNHERRVNGRIPSRHRIGCEREQRLAANEVYIGSGHISHRQKASKWASPFTVGQHGTVEECLISYTDYIGSSRLADAIGDLAGMRLRSDMPREMPYTTDVLIAMVYYARMNGSLKPPREYDKPRRRATLTPNTWTRRVLGMMVATGGDAWRAICSEGGSMTRQPPLPLVQASSWQQQVLTETSLATPQRESSGGSNFHTLRTCQLTTFQ